MTMLALVLLATAPARALEVEAGTGSVAESALGADRVRVGDQRLAASWAGAGLDWQLDYGYTRFEHRRADGLDRDNLHRLSLELQWQGTGALRPTVALRPVVATSSNVMKDFVARGSGDDWMLHAAASIAGDLPAGLQWQVALARDDAFGRLRAYPRAALVAERRSWRAELGWPVARLEVRAAPGLTLGAAVQPAGKRWHVVSDARAGAEFDYVLRAWRAGAHANWQPAVRWHLRAQAGVEFDRRLQFESDRGLGVDTGAGNARYVELGLAYRW
jgi:hypothetical protein